MAPVSGAEALKPPRRPRGRRALGSPVPDPAIDPTIDPVTGSVTEPAPEGPLATLLAGGRRAGRWIGSSAGRSTGPSAGRGTRLDRTLDAVGLLSLAWMIALWQLGTPGVPAFPGLADFPGITELSLRSRVTAVLVVLTLPLVIEVVIGFGRPPSRSRQLPALGLLVPLAVLVLWRFLVGFVLALPESRNPATGGIADTLPAGMWDAPAAALGFAAIAVLVIREYRLTRTALQIVTVAVGASVAAGLLAALLDLGSVFREADDRQAAIVGLAVLVPALLVSLVGVGMAPTWLRDLWQGLQDQAQSNSSQRRSQRAAAALVLWGVVAWGQQVTPAFLLFVLRQGRGTIGAGGDPISIAGLEAVAGAMAIAAALLIAPVARAYPRGRRGRAAILRGPLTVLAALLLAQLIGLLIEYWLLTGRDGIEPTEPAEQVVLLLALIGAGLVLLVAVRPRDRSVPWGQLAGTGLIAVPMALFIGSRGLGDSPRPRGGVGTIIPPFALWDGGPLLLVFVLPGVLFLLLTANRWANMLRRWRTSSAPA